ncbi:unnamed protein product, partial [Tetraodon nigroviridis]
CLFVSRVQVTSLGVAAFSLCSLSIDRFNAAVAAGPLPKAKVEPCGPWPPSCPSSGWAPCCWRPLSCCCRGSSRRRRPPTCGTPAGGHPDGHLGGPAGEDEGGRVCPGAVCGAVGQPLLAGADLPRGPRLVAPGLLRLLASALQPGLWAADPAHLGPAAGPGGPPWDQEAAGRGAAAPLGPHGPRGPAGGVRRARERGQHRPGLPARLPAGLGAAGPGPGGPVPALPALRRHAPGDAGPVRAPGPGPGGRLLLLLPGVRPRWRLLLHLHRRHLHLGLADLPASLRPRRPEDGVGGRGPAPPGPARALLAGPGDALLSATSSDLPDFTCWVGFLEE